MPSTPFITIPQDDTDYLSIKMRQDDYDQLDFNRYDSYRVKQETTFPKNKLIIIFFVLLAIFGYGFTMIKGPRTKPRMDKRPNTFSQNIENKVSSTIPVAPSQNKVQQNQKPTSSYIKGAHPNARTAKSKYSKKYKNYKLPKTSQKFSGTVVVNK